MIYTSMILRDNLEVVRHPPNPATSDPAKFSLTPRSPTPPTPPTMAALDDFPPEALRNIFFSLNQKDLVHASLVSRRWQAICEPILYENPVLKQQYTTSCYPPTTHGLELFLRTLVAPGRERLASHVRKIYLRWCRGIVALTPVRRSTLATLAAAESRYGVPHSSVYGSSDSQVVLLMHLLPRLRKVRMGMPDEQDSFRDFLDTIGPANPLPLAFQSLTKFYAQGGYRKDSQGVGIRPEAVLALLQLPHLENLEVEVRGQFDGPFPTDVHGTSRVTKLFLQYVDTSIALLEFLLRVPRALEKLEYYGPYMDGFTGVLSQLRATLTYLWVEFDDNEIPLGGAYSFRTWPVLRYLACPPELLIRCAGPPAGWPLAERLPVCTEVLHIVNWECGSDTEWTPELAVQDLVLLVTVGKPMVPFLKWVMVNRDSWVCYVSKEVQEVLLAACESTGVQLYFNFPV